MKRRTYVVREKTTNINMEKSFNMPSLMRCNTKLQMTVHWLNFFLFNLTNKWNRSIKDAARKVTHNYMPKIKYLRGNQVFHPMEISCSVGKILVATATFSEPPSIHMFI